MSAQQSKAPTLRNVEMIGPCLHDGAVWTLEEAVDMIGRQHSQREMPASSPF